MEDLHRLATEFGLFRFLYGYIPANWLPVGGGDVESHRRMFLYLIAPAAFGTRFPNRLLSKCADYVGYGRNGPFDPYSHSLEEEAKFLLMLNQVQTFMVVLPALPDSCVYQVKYNLNSILSMKNPVDVLNFGKEKCGGLIGVIDWPLNDTLILLHVITMLLVFNDDFREEAFKELLTCGADNIFDAALAMESADRAVRNGNSADGLELYIRALKLNPLNDKIYNKLSQMYCKTEKYEFARWFAVRSVWIFPYDAEHHLQWLKSVERIPDMTVAAMKFAQLICACMHLDKKYKKEETLTEIEALFNRLRFKVLGTVVREMTADGYPSYILNVSESNVMTWQSLTNVEDKKWSVFLLVFHAFTELFGFIPLQWIHMFPALLPHDRMYTIEEMRSLQGNFVDLISPFTFGVNYPNANLAKCAEYVNIFKKVPINHSFEEETETIALVRFSQIFLIFNMQTALIYQVSNKDVKKVLNLSEPKKIIEFGRSIITRSFETSVKWIDNDKAVFLYVVSLMMSRFKVFADDAFNDMKFDMNAFRFVCSSNEAKACMKRKDYKEALSIYNQLSKHYPQEAVLFGNMAQAYIHIENYDFARRSAFRSILALPCVPKNYYRWIKATDLMGKFEDVSRICSSISSCVAASGYFGEVNHCIELEAMCKRLSLKVSNLATGRTQAPKKTDVTVQGIKTLKDTHSAANDVMPELPSSRGDSLPEVPNPASQSIHVQENSKKTDIVVEERAPVAVSSSNGKSKSNSASGVTPSKQPVKTNAKLKRQSTPEIVVKNKSDVYRKDDVPKFCNASSTYQKYLHDGSEFFVKSVYKLAVQNYSAALDLLRSQGVEAFELSEMDVILLKYCYGKACIERNSQEHICISIEMFDEIINQNCISFPMAYYGKGLAFYRLNKFLEAIGPLEKCLEVISKCVHFEAYLYPGLQTEVIKESYQDKLKELAEGLVVICRTPPVPDAICFNTECPLTSKIYFNDVEFLGYSRLTCHDKCHVEFHPVCWKGFMTKNKIHGDENVMGRSCSTPDCKSFVTKLEHIGPDSLVRKMVEASVEPKPKLSKTFVKPKNQPHQKEGTKHVTKKRVHVDSAASNISDQEERRSSTCEKEQLDRIAASAPDTRNAENALLILKKLDDSLKQPMKKSVSVTEKKKKALKCHPSYHFFDRERISALQMQRSLAEATTNDYSPRVRLDSSNPFAIPSQEFRSNPLLLETYLRQLQPSNVSTSEMDEIPTMNSLDCSDLKQNVLEYVEQYVIANGPVSITSRRFLDEINSFETEVQELVIACEGIRNFLSTSRLLFIGDVALMRENLQEITAGSLFLRGLDVAVGCGFPFSKISSILTANSVPNFFERGRFKRSNSSEAALINPILTGDVEDSSVSSIDSHSGSVRELNVNDKAGTDKDENCNVLDYESELVQELQLYKDKLFGLRKEMNVEIKLLKDQLDEIQNTNDASQKKIKELERDCDSLTKKLATEKQNANQEIMALQSKLTKQGAEAGNIWMNAQEISNEERGKRQKLEGDVDTLTKTLAAMESNHDGLVQENRQLKDRISSLELKLADELEKSTMSEATIDPNKMDQSPPQLQNSPRYIPNNPYCSHPKLGVPYFGSFPMQYQPVIPPLMHGIRPSSSLENLYIRSASQGTYTFPPPFHKNKSKPSTDNENSVPIADVRETATVEKQSDALPSMLTKTKDSKPNDVNHSRKKNSSVTPSPPITDPVPSSFDVNSTENVQLIFPSLEGCSLSYAAKAAVQPKVLPQAQETGHESGFGCSEYVNRIFDKVKKRFPRMHKSEFLTYLQLTRSNNKNSLTGLKLKVIASRICKEAEEFSHMRKRSVSTSSSRRDSESFVEPPIAPGPSFWSEVMEPKTGAKPKASAKPKKKIGEDVCSICLCDIMECDAHFLQCIARHVFHKKCIREWYYKGEESCPLCRESAPLHEEFPTLGY